MTGIKQSPTRRMILIGGRSHPPLTEAVAAQLGVELVPTTAYDFANGEIFVRFEESVRGCDAFVLQSHTDPINTWIMEQLLMVDALKRASAKRITAVVPFYGYARQDKKHSGREPISARLVADMFKVAGADRLMTVDLHTSQIQGFFDGPVDHLFATPILVRHVAQAVDDRRAITVVAPDAGRVRVAERWTDMLGSPLAIIHKRRDPDVPNEARVLEVVGQVEGRICVIIDDMIDTGGTISKAADVLFDKGAAEVFVAATHGILSGPRRRAVQELPHQRDHRHRHAADRERPPLRQAHDPPRRAADRPGDHRGLRGRVGDLDVPDGTDLTQPERHLGRSGTSVGAGACGRVHSRGPARGAARERGPAIDEAAHHDARPVVPVRPSPRVTPTRG